MGTKLPEFKLSAAATKALRAAVDTDAMTDAIADLRARAAEHAPDAVAALERGYKVRNADGADDGPAVVRIYDEIWWLGVNAEDLIDDLGDITADEIRVEINSPGGSMFDGIAIYNAIRNHPATVTTRVDGMAASAASLIVQAGDSRVMQPGTQQMIHNAWGLTVGDHRDHAQMADLLEQSDGQLAGIYAARSGKPVDEIRELMNAETWLVGEAAVDAGLADEAIITETPASDTGNGSQNRVTLNDQISAALDGVEEAITSAVTVGAVRAEAGKDLSTVNRESLDGLRAAMDRLNGLLETPSEDEPDPDDVWSDTDLARRLGRLEALGA